MSLSPCGASAALDEAKAGIDALKAKISGGLESIGDLGAMADTIKAKLQEVNVPKTPSFNLHEDLASLSGLSSDEYTKKVAQIKAQFSSAMPNLDEVIAKIPKPLGLTTAGGKDLFAQLNDALGNVGAAFQNVQKQISAISVDSVVANLCGETKVDPGTGKEVAVVPNLEVEAVIEQTPVLTSTGAPVMVPVLDDTGTVVTISKIETVVTPTSVPVLDNTGTVVTISKTVTEVAPVLNPVTQKIENVTTTKVIQVPKTVIENVTTTKVIQVPKMEPKLVDVIDSTGNKKAKIDPATGAVVTKPAAVKPPPTKTPATNPVTETKASPAPAGGFTFAFTKEKLVAACGKDAAQYYDAFVKHLPEFGITTPERCAAFLGTIKAETDFKKFTENLNYNAYNLYLHKDVITIKDPKTGKPRVIKGVEVNPGHKRFPTLQDAERAVKNGIQYIANLIYGGRMGNGDVASGDGYKFRGRGMFQLTGKDQYKLASIQLKKPEILTNPDSVLTNPELCVLTATNYFAKKHVGAHADKTDWKEVRRKVNGGLVGYDHMREATEKAYKIFKA